MTKQEKRFGNAMNCPCGNTLTDENLLEDGKCADGKKWCDTCVLNGACSCDIHTGTTPDWIGIPEVGPEIDTEWLNPDSIRVRSRAKALNDCDEHVYGSDEYPLAYLDPAQFSPQVVYDNSVAMLIPLDFIISVFHK